MAGRSFNATERFVSDVSSRKLKAAYVLVGDELFFRDRCRAALLEHLVPPDLRDFSLHDDYQSRRNSEWDAATSRNVGLN